MNGAETTVGSIFRRCAASGTSAPIVVAQLFDAVRAVNARGTAVLLAESGEHLPVNLGNPGEFTLNELAETVLRITSSKSEVVYEALPVDDPQVRQPDITRARQLLGWEPQVQLEEGLRRMLPSFGREPLVA